MSLNIPTIDISNNLDKSTAHSIGRDISSAFEATGFCKIVGHGVSSNILKNSYGIMEYFFNQDTEYKKLFSNKNGQLGYFALGSEHAKDHNIPDLKEFFHVMSPLKYDNVWPSDAFRGASVNLYSAMYVTAVETLSCLDEYLGTNFSFDIVGGNSLLRLLHYPSLEKFKDLSPGAVRAAPHEDINLITFLPAATTSGLELLTKEGKWESVDANPGELVVNVGDMLQMASNGRFKSTTHRVVNPMDSGSQGARYSIPFFVHPRAEVSLGTMTAGSYLEQRLKEIGLK